MKLQVFAVYDEKALIYGSPFVTKTSGEAIRMFSDACSMGNSLLSAHPADFTLYQIAVFDDSIGSFESFSSPNYLCKGSAVIIHKTVPICAEGDE